MQFAAAHHLERVVPQFLDANRDVGEQLLFEPVAQVPRGDPLPLPPGKRPVVDGERDGDGRLVDADLRQRLRRFRAGDGFPDGDALHPRDRQNIAGDADDFVHALQPFERIELRDFGGLERAVALDDGHGVAVIQRAARNAADAQTAEIIAVIEVGDEHLEDAGAIAGGRGNVLDDGLEERAEVGGWVVHRALRHAGLGDGVEHWKIELFLGGVEIDEKVVDLVQHFRHTRVGAIDLVDHDDGRKVRFQGLREDIARLGQRPFAGIDEQHDAVHDLEGPLHFAPEIAVAGGVDDVDLNAVVANARDFGQDGDAALALEIVGIHHSFDVLFVYAKDAALVEHGIHEGGLAMVDVRDDGDITDGIIGRFH